MKKLALLAALLLTAPLQAAPGTIRASGDVAKPMEWSVSQLKTQFSKSLQTVTYALKGRKRTAQCLSLLELVRSLPLRLDPKAKNPSLSFIAIVQAKDGYAISFSLGELSPEFGDRKVWLAFDEDGEPLPEKEGPARLVIPGDSKPTRWIYGVTSIVMKDGGRLAR
jgi:hypothetical protein